MKSGIFAAAALAVSTPAASSAEPAQAQAATAEDKAYFVAVGAHAVADYQSAQNGENPAKPNKRDAASQIRVDFEVCATNPHSVNGGTVENRAGRAADRAASGAARDVLGNTGRRVLNGLGGLGGILGTKESPRERAQDQAECRLTKGLEPSIKNAIELKAAGKDNAAVLESIGRRVDEFVTRQDASDDRQKTRRFRIPGLGL